MKKLNDIKCIFEKVYVETPVDTDRDGKADLIAVYIRRPETADGEKVPAVYVANPYMLTCNEDDYIAWDVNREVKAYPDQNISEEDIRFDFSKEPEYSFTEIRETKGFAETAPADESVLEGFECISELYDYLNHKGYASVFCGGLGTRGSDGLTLTGSREEIMAFKSVIDWLNGRARAFTNKTDNIEIKASWCTGNVAMSAKSYLGTMCIGVAATGVEGLKTIIPEAAISNWYNYYRQNGLNAAALAWQGDEVDLLSKYCFSRMKDADDYAVVKDLYDEEMNKMVSAMDRDSANYSRFWDERNYLNQVSKIKASVFIIHGLNDWNVKTNQCLPFFEELEKLGIERKIMLHQGDHIYIYDLQDSDNLTLVERWLDHYLKGIDNGIDREPSVLVQSNLDQKVWEKSDVWPPEGTKHVSFPVSADADVLEITDDINATVYDKEKDNMDEWRDELVTTDYAGKGYKNAVKFLWDPFAECEDSPEVIRISGYTRVSFDAAIDKNTAILSAMLVDMGEDKRLTLEHVVTDQETGSFVFKEEETPSAYKVISRGCMNAQNRTNNWSKEETLPGQKYHYELSMVPTDHLLKKGHKLALIIYGIDAEQTQRPDTVTKIRIDTSSIRAEVPMVL